MKKEEHLPEILKYSLFVRLKTEKPQHKYAVKTLSTFRCFINGNENIGKIIRKHSEVMEM